MQGHERANPHGARHARTSTTPPAAKRVAGGRGLRHPSEPEGNERLGAGAQRRGLWAEIWRGAVGNPLAAAALATALAAIVSALVGAAALRYTALQSYATAQQVAQAGQEQFAERYGRDIDQLGGPTIDVRVGGIYGLEGLARDSPSYQPSIVYVLGTFISDHTSPPRSSACSASSADNRSIEQQAVTNDVAAAIVVLSRRNRSLDPAGTIDLSHMCLANLHLFRGLNLGPSFVGFTFTQSNLHGSVLRYAGLRGVDLSGADLTNVDLTQADLTGANLRNADLTGANLAGAGLVSANLADANLTGANISAADIRGAFGANLTNAFGHAEY